MPGIGPNHSPSTVLPEHPVRAAKTAHSAIPLGYKAFMPETLPPAYGALRFPPPPPGRPYVFTNMVVTLDGKTVSGSRHEAVIDLGSKTDHATMRHIQASADAVTVGAGTVRATKGIWFPEHLVRIVVSRTGDLPAESRFFADAPEKAVVAVPEAASAPNIPGVEIWRGGGVDVDLVGLLAWLREHRGVERLLAEGGSELNGALFGLGLVDEMFITLAPKVKLGRETPTYAGGEPLPRGSLLEFALIEGHQVGSEMYLRYRRLA